MGNVIVGEVFVKRAGLCEGPRSYFKQIGKAHLGWVLLVT